MHASNRGRLDKSIQEVVDILDVPGRTDPKIDIYGLLYSSLKSPRSGPWLVILDNADDERMFDKSGKSVSSFIPHSGHGALLMTTRSRRAALTTCEPQNVLEVTAMSPDEAVCLLLSRLTHSPSKEESYDLVKILDCIPLAISQAGAYIEMQSTDCRTYLRLLEENESSILNEDFNDLRRDAEVPNSIIATWRISFELILETSPEAIELLSLMSLLDRQGIPRSLLEEGYARKLGWTLEDFINARAVLLGFHLVYVEREADTFTIHRLVQLSTQAWLSANSTLLDWQHWALLIVQQRFPAFEAHNYLAAAAELIPHAEAILRWTLGSTEDLESLAALEMDVYNYEFYAGRYSKAEKHARRLLKLTYQLYSDEGHPSHLALKKFVMQALLQQGLYQSSCEIMEDIPNAMDDTECVTIKAAILQGQGKYEETEALLRAKFSELSRIIRIAESGPLDESAATYLKDEVNWAAANTFGLVLAEQGKLSQAIVLQRALLLVLGSSGMGGSGLQESMLSINGRANLALSLFRKGKGEEASQLCREVYEKSRTRLGNDHPLTLLTHNNVTMMWVIKSVGREKDRRELEFGARSCAEILGQTHPTTLLIRLNLAQILSGQARYGEAETLVKNITEETLYSYGPQHPLYVLSMSLWTNLLSREKLYSEAQETLDLLRPAIKKLGPSHLATLAAQTAQIRLLLATRRPLEAETQCREILGLLEKTHGRTSRLIIVTLALLATILRDQGKDLEAQGLEEDILATYESETDPQAQELQDTEKGELLLQQGNASEAEAIFDVIFKRRQRELGEDHSDTLHAMRCYANALKACRRFEEAERLYREEIERRERVYGGFEHSTLIAKNNLAVWFYEQKRYEEGEVLLTRVLQAELEKLGPSNPDYITTAQNLILNLISQKKFAECENLGREVHEQRIHRYGARHEETATSMAHLAEILWGLEKHREAEILDRQSLSLRESIFGPEHSIFLRGKNNLAVSLIDNCENKNGSLAEAKVLLEEVVTVRRRTLPPTHEDLLVSIGNLASASMQLRQLEDAETLYREVVDRRLDVLGELHERTLYAQKSLADVLWLTPKKAEAESLERRSMNGMEKLFGSIHDVTLVAKNNLALNLTNNMDGHDNWFTEAETLLAEVIAVQRNSLPPTDERLLVPIFNLGVLYEKGEMYAECERLFREVMEKRLASLGAVHELTISSFRRLADSLWALERFLEAEELQKKILDSAEQLLGPHHRSSLAAKHNLAFKLKKHHAQDSEKLRQAETLFRDVLRAKQMESSLDFESLLMTLQELIATVEALGEEQSALEFRQVRTETRLKFIASLLGIDKYDVGAISNACHVRKGAAEKLTVSIIKQLAHASVDFGNSGRYSEALKFLEILTEWFVESDLRESEVLIIVEPLTDTLCVNGLHAGVIRLRQFWTHAMMDRLGTDDQLTLFHRYRLALHLNDFAAKFTEAEEIYRDIYQRRERLNGSEHLDTLVSLHNLASAVRKNGRLVESLQILRDVYSRGSSLLGRDHPLTLSSLGAVACCLHDLGQWQEALRINEEVLAMQRKICDEGDLAVIQTKGNLAFRYCCAGRHDKAAALQREVSESRQRALGDKHIDTLTALSELGVEHIHMADFKKALDLLQKAYKGRVDVLGAMHRDTLASQGDIAMCLSKMDLHEEAAELGEQALDSKRASMDETDPAYHFP